MQALESRITALEDKAISQQASLSKSFKILCIFYIIAIVVVAIYTSWVLSFIKQTTSPDMAAAVLQGYLQEEIPAQRKNLIEQLNSNADKVAKDSVDLVVNSIPKIESEAQKALDRYTDILINEIQKETIPAFAEFVKKDAAELESHYKDMTDEDVAKGIAGLFVETIDAELDKVITDRITTDMDELQTELRRLARGKDLTRMEDAKRRVILNWTLMQGKIDVGESPVQALFKKINDRYRFFSGEDMEQMSTELVDPDVTGTAELTE